MPNIRSSADLRNSYNDISEFCHTYSEPVFITKNGNASDHIEFVLKNPKAADELLDEAEWKINTLS